MVISWPLPRPVIMWIARARLWSDDRGQDIAEYAVMLAVILVIVVGTVRLIGSNANTVFSEVASSVQQPRSGCALKPTHASLRYRQASVRPEVASPQQGIPPPSRKFPREYRSQQQPTESVSQATASAGSGNPSVSGSLSRTPARVLATSM